MKPLDPILHLSAPLRSFAFASALGAAAFLSSGTNARAALVGHWLTGAENLADSSGFTPAGTHDGVAVGGNAGLLAYSEDVPFGFTGKSLDLRAGGGGNVSVQISNTATADAGYLNTFDGGVSSQLSVAFWAKGFPVNGRRGSRSAAKTALAGRSAASATAAAPASPCADSTMTMRAAAPST